MTDCCTAASAQEPHLGVPLKQCLCMPGLTWHCSRFCTSSVCSAQEPNLSILQSSARAYCDQAVQYLCQPGTVVLTTAVVYMLLSSMDVELHLWMVTVVVQSWLNAAYTGCAEPEGSGTVPLVGRYDCMAVDLVDLSVWCCMHV